MRYGKKRNPYTMFVNIGKYLELVKSQYREGRNYVFFILMFQLLGKKWKILLL